MLRLQRWLPTSAGLVLGWLSLQLTAPVLAEQPAEDLDPSAIEFFEKEIRPVLVNHCHECHSTDANRVQGGLLLDSREGLLEGGASGEVVVPGAPETSRLLEAIRYEDLQMPPDGKLPDHVIAAFEQWIAMGAPDPRTADAETLQAAREQTLWSFQSPVRPSLPTVERGDWPHNAIDYFILAELEVEGIAPVSDADRRSLIRRLYLDLIGLPPQPEEVEEFVNDGSPKAYERLVDRLLGSPHFGKKWARHWLDVARYAESSGREFNFTYPYAWPYRDYVIEAFNADKPYDQFIREQIAGDLIAAQEDAEGARLDELQIATGLLAVGPKRHNAGRRDFTADLADDQIDTVSQAILGTTVACARCHDHKFDPIPTEDYYALVGIFSSTQVLDGTIDQQYSRYPTDPIPIGPNAQQRHEAAEAHDRQVEKVTNELEETQEQLEEAESNSDAEEGRVAELKQEVESLEAELEQLQADAPQRPDYAMGVRDRDEPEDARVAIGGDLRNLGDPVPRGFLSELEMVDVPQIDDEQSGRLQLAHWLSDPQNPLTARVMVNRLWKHLFGRGLVSTVDNFGVLGRPPSHPELLDYLALQFIDDHWSIKQMIRTMVLSRTYQLSTTFAEESFAADPQNILRWRMSPRRLEAEPLRDAMLAISGQLDRAAPRGSSVTALGTQLARGVGGDQLQPPSNRRSVYLPAIRDYLPEILQTFDYASASMVVGERSVTTVPAQALYLLNSDFALKQSEHMARRLLAIEAMNDAERVEQAWLLAYSRPPSEGERQQAMQLVGQTENDGSQASDADQETDRLNRWTALCQSLMASAEFRYLVDPERSLP